MYSKSLLYVNIGKLSGVNEHYISPYYFSVEFLYIRILLMNKPNLTSYIHESPLSLRTRLPVSVQSESDRIQRPRIKALISCTHIPGLSSHKHCITIGRGLSTYLAASPPPRPAPLRRQQVWGCHGHRIYRTAAYATATALAMSGLVQLLRCVPRRRAAAFRHPGVVTRALD